MKELSWGRARMFARLKGKTDSPTIAFPIACDGTTNLSVSRGEKKEAKIEGGAVEAVKYGANTFSGEFQIRAGVENGKRNLKPIADNDGIIEGVYELWMQPENPEAPGFHISDAVMGLEDAFTTGEGATWKYTFDALKPTDGTNTVKWGKVAYDKDSNTVTFTEDTAAPAE